MQPAEETQPPAISVVAPPMPEEQLADAQRVIVSLTQEKETLARKLEQAEADRDFNKAQWDALQNNPLSLVLATLDHGGLLSEAGQLLTALVDTVLCRAAKGALGIVITVEPRGLGQVDITGSLKLKEPAKDEPISIFYFDQGKVTRQDPRQRHLRL